MKQAQIKYFLLLAGLLLFFGCNNQSGKNVVAETDPVFQSDPRLKKLTEKITNTPGDAALYFQRGNLLHKMQFDSLALKDYRRATTLDTGKAEYYSAIGSLLFDNRDLTGSVDWFQKAIARDPNDKRAHLKIAKLFLYTRDYPKAFAEINIVLRKNVYDPEAYFLKGMLYKDMKDTAKAISTFQTAVQVAPDFRDAVLQLGIMYSAKNDPLALRYFDNAFKMDTTDVFPIFARGTYYQQNKDYVSAKQEYKRCILRDRHFADAYFNMGYLLMQDDSLEKAWRQYDYVTKIDPANPTGYYNRGVCSEMMDSMKSAVADYHRAASLDTGYKSPREALKRLHVN